MYSQLMQVCSLKAFFTFVCLALLFMSFAVLSALTVTPNLGYDHDCIHGSNRGHDETHLHL